VCGVFIYPICCLFGLPFTHAATIRSLTHLISLTEFEEVTVTTTDEKGQSRSATMKQASGVAEQRVTQLIIHTLIGLSAFPAPVLKHLPQAVLYGVFLFMGVSTISGNALFDRLSLWFIWDASKYPAYPFIQGISLKKLHAYTFIQVSCLVILYALKSIKAVAVVFPFFLIIIVFVRMFMTRFYTVEELRVLDGVGPVETDEKVAADDKAAEDKCDHKLEAQFAPKIGPTVLEDI